MPEQQLRIGVIGARGIFDMQGGVETYCSSFYRRLDPDLFSITIFASRSRVHSPLPPNLTVVRVPAPALRSLETPVGALLGVMLARLCGIRLVHVHGLSSCICLPLARMLGMSIVVRHMGAEYRRAKWGAAARAVLHLGETFAARFADTVICLNDDIRREFSASTGRRHGLHVIANGVDPPLATCPRALHQELGLEPGGYVLGVGRLVPEKQFDTLIGAFLRADLPQRYKLVIVGAAAHSEKHVRTLRSLAGGSERVVFAGERFGADLWVLYRQCAMFVLPSTHEGMSFSLLEASGAGAMVIASDIRANATVCGDYGVLFPVGSAAALADAITAGAASVRTQEEIDRQILVCKTRHDWNAIARLTEAVFLDTHRSRQVERRGVPHAVGGGGVKLARRVVVVALSEASPLLVERFMAEGRMPRLKALCDEGVTGQTRYEAPFLLTPQMWATILTGRGAGSHGLFDYWRRDADGSFKETRGQDIDGPRLWDAMAAQGLSGGYVNAPMTFPPPRTPGFAISGQDAPGAHRSIAFPERLFDDAQAKFGRYRHKDIFPGTLPKAAYGRAIPREVARQADLFAWLTARGDTDFLLLYSSGTAFAQHYFWSDMEQAQRGCAQTIAATYAACDSLIGRVRDAMAPADILMVISECGAGPLSAGVRLNTWLQREGFLARSHRGSSPTARLATAARRLAPKVIPRSAFHAVNRLPLKAWVQGRISDDGIDWSRTSAFHRGKGEGNIYINLLGRDRHGVVAPCDYDGVRQDIIDRLARLRDPATDSPAVAAVHRREDLFEGPHADGAPDIVVEWKNFAYMPAESGDADGPLFGPRVREYMDWPTSGSHRRQGFLMAHGEGLRQGPLRQAVDLRDLAPTWVELLGGRAPGAMHGRSRAPDFLTQTPATPTQAT